MRVLVVAPEYPPHTGGGILKYYNLLAEAWAATGVDVTVLVSTPYSSFDGYERNGVAVRFVPLADVQRRAAKLSHLAQAPQFRQWLAAGLAAAEWVRQYGDAFDVVETTDFGLLFAPLVCLESRPPVLVKLHGSLGQISEHETIAPAAQLDFALARLIEQVCLPAADGLCAYSPANASEWSRRLGVEVAFIPPSLAIPEQTDSPSDSAFTGVVVGRVQPWKGPEVVCRAVELMQLGADSEFRIAWVGRDTNSAPDGQSMSAWLTKTYPGVWGSRVVPIGTRTAPQVASLQSSVRFCVVPSLWDTFNFTLAESMSLRAVTVGSTGAGASYLIENGSSGLTFEAGDATQAAAALEEAWRLDRRGRDSIGDAARETVIRELDPGTVAERNLRCLSDLVGKPCASRPGPWVRGFLSEGESAGSLDFLNNVGIRDLVAHLGERATRKIKGK